MSYSVTPTYPSRNTGAKPLYTAEQRKRRDSTVWTLVQGILAPLQFIVFLVSLMLVFRTLFTGSGYEAATVSIIIKTLILYVIMITGSIWEKVVFGKYLFVDSFFWEDVFSMLVLALHTAYLAAYFFTDMAPTSLLFLALAAYAAYIVNAVQFLLKLRQARLQSETPCSGNPADRAENNRHNNPQAVGNLTQRGSA
ncbi:MAG: 2-vinyl bacteriochlorophyllide hydratase [Pseudomonadota bacterium]